MKSGAVAAEWADPVITNNSPMLGEYSFSHRLACAQVLAHVPVNVTKLDGKIWTRCVLLTRQKDNWACVWESLQTTCATRNLYWSQWGELNTEHKSSSTKQQQQQHQPAEWLLLVLKSTLINCEPCTSWWSLINLPKTLKCRTTLARCRWIDL